MRLFSHNHSGADRGFTMIDILASVLVIALALAGIITANARSTAMLRSAKQAAVASKCLQQRIEQIRTYNWTQITDSQAMQDLYASPPLPSVELPGFAEQVTISTFTPATASGQTAAAPVAPFLQIARNTDGSVTLLSDNQNLVDSGGEVRVDVQITWPGPGGATRTRATSVIIANGGVGR
jgi:Tfp pilus assembly protein PilV